MVTGGACILPRDCKIAGLRDSKFISPKKRIRLAAEIKLCAITWSVAHVSSEKIDRSNILIAAEMAMYEAIHGLDVMPDHLLIDAKSIDIPISQTSILHGDALSCSIAAASIVAKVARDELMVELDAKYPEYKRTPRGRERRSRFAADPKIAAKAVTNPPQRGRAPYLR